MGAVKHKDAEHNRASKPWISAFNVDINPGETFNRGLVVEHQLVDHKARGRLWRIFGHFIVC